MNPLANPTHQPFSWRLIRMSAGFFVFALGIVMTINANIGLAPWDVFHQGLSKVMGITFGQAGILVGAVIVVIDYAAGERIGWGTLGNMLMIGLFIDLIMLNGWVPEQQVFMWGIFQMMAGIFIIGIGSYLYISVGLGCGPRDGLMVALLKKTGRSVRLVRGIIESGALLCGWLLGGTVGLGTVIMALVAGPVIQWSFALLRFDVKAVEHEYMDHYLRTLGKRLRNS